MISTAALLFGATAGGGLVLLVRELLPSHPDLGQSLERIHTTTAPTEQPLGPVPFPDRVGLRILKTAGASLKLPRRELDLLGIPVAHHVGAKALGALWGLILPQLVSALAALASTPLPWPLPMGVSLGLAVLLWFNADADVRDKANRARLEFRHAIASYLERVGLERAADAGAVEALHRAAAVGDSWVLARIRGVLHHAQLAGIPPWEALKQLAEQLDVPELARPAETLALAGEEGAAVYNTLRAQARSLRGALLTDAQAQANEASEKMIVPVTVLVLLMMVLLGFPAFSRIMTS